LCNVKSAIAKCHCQTANPLTYVLKNVEKLIARKSTQSEWIKQYMFVLSVRPIFNFLVNQDTHQKRVHQLAQKNGPLSKVGIIGWQTRSAPVGSSDNQINSV